MNPTVMPFDFPDRGLDLSAAVNNQRPQTTPVATNVRLFDSFQERARGGSRPGLVQFIPQQLPLE